MSETTIEPNSQPATETPPLPPPTPRVYFYKELFSNAFVVGGKPVAFEPLNGNRGVICLDPAKDQMVIDALTDAALKHRGGVVKIPYEQYMEKKSLHPFNPLEAQLKKNMLRPLPSVKNFKSRASAPVAVADQAPHAAASPATGSPAPSAPSPSSVSTAPPFKPSTRRIQRDAHGIPVPPSPVPTT